MLPNSEEWSAEEKEMIENAYENGKTGEGNGSHYYLSLFNQDS